MKIKFLGAARTVTGSCFVIETDKTRFAIDCGMHQGSNQIEKRNLEITPYEPKKIEFFIITHAHIDHSGLLPRMVQNGFHGPIYATEPTGDLLKILLLDSAHIQEVEATGRNKRLQRSGMKADAAPLYTTKDAEAVMPLVKTRKYDEMFSPAPGISIRFQDAGHILGAAIVELFIEENGETVKLVFSGISPSQSTPDERSEFRASGGLFCSMESTYGNRNTKANRKAWKNWPKLSDTVTTTGKGDHSRFCRGKNTGNSLCASPSDARRKAAQGHAGLSGQPPGYQSHGDLPPL